MSVTNEIHSQLLKEKMYFDQLDNGLKVYTMPMEGYTKQYAIFATNYGSIDSKFKIMGEEKVIEVPDGIAHFLEHKLFEERDGSIFDKFSELGSNVNAYTNFTSTCYLFTSTDRFLENLELLVKFVQSPYFTDENVEKEKGIITQEINMYKDNPQWKVFFNALRAMYHNHPVKIDIAGTVDSISRITKEELYTCYNNFYSPHNMTLFIAGDIDHAEALKVIKMSMNEKPFNTKIIQRVYPEEPNNIVQDTIEEHLDVSIPLFNIAYKDILNNSTEEKLLNRDISTKILLDMLFGKSSELYSSLYEEGLINDTFEHEFTGELGYGYSMMGGESKDPLLIRDRIHKHIELLKKVGLSKEDFERIKRKQIGEHLGYYNSVEFIATTFIAYHFKGIQLFDYIKAIKKIQFTDIEKRFLDHFCNNQSILSIISPK